MNTIQYGNRIIQYNIKKGKRKKTVAIHINPMATITVFSPRHLDDEKIRMIVQKKARWILEKQKQVESNRYSNSMKEFVSGESFPYLGKYYRLKVIKTSKETTGKCRLTNGRFLVEIKGNHESEVNRTVVKKALVDWYLERAETKIKERVDRFSQQIGKWPTSIRIKNQERRWGSCSRNGMIRFNWKIIMVPISIMDYVIVHELCHLIYPHHSDHFWQKIQSILPDYKRRRDWLKANSFQKDVL
jgi:predicted metal-dependent hydrolase